MASKTNAARTRGGAQHDDSTSNATAEAGRILRWYRWAEDLERHPRLSPVAKRVAWQFAARADGRTGECWPSRGYLATKLETSTRSVTRALGELREVDALAVVRAETQHAPPLYRLSEQALAEVPELPSRVDTPVQADPSRVDTPVQPETAQGGHPCPPGWTSLSSRVDTSVHQNHPRTTQEPASLARARAEGGGEEEGERAGEQSATARSTEAPTGGSEGKVSGSAGGHLAAWVVHELTVANHHPSKTRIAAALEANARPDALAVARTLAAEVKAGLPVRNIVRLFAYRLAHDDVQAPTPPPPYAPEDAPEPESEWQKAKREEAEQLRRFEAEMNE